MIYYVDARLQRGAWVTRRLLHGVTPANNEASQSGLIKDNTENKYADSNAGKDNFEENLELGNAKRDAQDNNYDSNKVKPMKKSNFRIISVTDTVSHVTDNESVKLDDEKVETNNEFRNNN